MHRLRHGGRRWLPSGIFIITLVSGCTTSPEFQVSVPSELPVGVKGRINDEMIELNLDKLTVAVQLQNFQTEPGGASRPLGLWLEIGSAQGDFTLDPRQVTLTSGAGSSKQALTFLGPSDAWQSPRAVARGCGPRRYALGWSISKVDVSLEDVQHGNPSKGVRVPAVGPVSGEGKQCFMFWFDTDPSPDVPFIVSIGGLSRAGVPLSTLEISYRRGLVRKKVIP